MILQKGNLDRTCSYFLKLRFTVSRGMKPKDHPFSVCLFVCFLLLFFFFVFVVLLLLFFCLFFCCCFFFKFFFFFFFFKLFL